MDIVLDLTATPGKGLQVPGGLNVTHVLHDGSVRKDLAGMHRPRYVRALAGGGYDYYAYFPNDLNVTAEALDALCAWQTPLAGTNLMVGLLRWEARKDDHMPRKLLNDHALCCPPHLGGVVNVEGHRFMVPSNPHYAAWFLPASRLRCVLERHASYSNETGADWSVPPSGRTQSLEYYEGLWLMPWLIRVVPLDGYEGLLAHHLSDKYARTTAIRMVGADALRKAAEGFSGFEPVTLPGPGVRGR